MPDTIILQVGYKTTIEDCPVCRLPGMTVKHGYSETGSDNYLHLENCKECGESIVIVGYDCRVCTSAGAMQPTTGRTLRE